MHVEQYRIKFVETVALFLKLVLKNDVDVKRSYGRYFRGHNLHHRINL